MASKDKNDLQSAFKKLEEIVEDLSGGNVDVEMGLEKFKKGAELIQMCHRRLKKAENEFKKIKTKLEMEAVEEMPREDDLEIADTENDQEQLPKDNSSELF